MAGANPLWIFCSNVGGGRRNTGLGLQRRRAAFATCRQTALPAARPRRAAGSETRNAPSRGSPQPGPARLTSRRSIRYLIAGATACSRKLLNWTVQTTAVHRIPCRFDPVHALKRTEVIAPRHEDGNHLQQPPAVSGRRCPAPDQSDRWCRAVRLGDRNALRRVLGRRRNGVVLHVAA